MISKENRASKPDQLEFKYYLTTRGLNSKGLLVVLEYLPKDFRPFITVVSSASSKAAIKKKYPTVRYWTSPDEINTAALKRKWIFNSTKADEFFLINDELRLFLGNKNGSTSPVRGNEAEFYSRLKTAEELARSYVGFSLHPRSFSNSPLAEGKSFVENKLVGAFFTFRKNFALNELELGRLNYHEDIDYTLQTLSKGYSVCQYLGILYEATTYKPRRQFIDRTQEIMDRDTKRIMSSFPEAISMKKKYDPVEMNINIDIGWSKAYRPTSKVLFICHGNINRSAASELIAKELYPRHCFKSAGVKDDAGNEITSAKMRRALRKAGYHGVPIRSSACTQKLINWADVVVYMDDGNLERLKKFKVSPSKLLSMGNLIGLPKIKDPAFSGPEEFDRCISNIEKALPLLMKARKSWQKKS